MFNGKYITGLYDGVSKYEELNKDKSKCDLIHNNY